MKNEIMSRVEQSGLVSLFLGLFGYTIFMFFLIANRTKGINYFDDLYTVNKYLVYCLVVVQYILMRLAKYYQKKNEIHRVNFLWIIGACIGGILVASILFTIIL